jgi:hypothetical protein
MAIREGLRGEGSLPLINAPAARREALRAEPLLLLDVYTRVAPPNIPPSLFEVYTRMSAHTPGRAWTVLRLGSLAGAGLLAALLFILPSLGLWLFWTVLVTALPLVLIIAPGFWRNVCPIATVNQLPRRWRRGRGRALPAVVQRHGPLLSMLLFLAVLPLRLSLLSTSGPALAAFLVTVLGLALAGGWLFKGKSGWCSQFCPMLPVERLYGQSPLRVVRNDYCKPCVACSKNCYDFNPTAAHLADLTDGDRRWSVQRRLFAGALPWVIAGFNLWPAPHLPGMASFALAYPWILGWAAAGGLGFLAIERLTGAGAHRVALAHVVVALNLFYGFALPAVAPTWSLAFIGGWVVPHVAVAVLSLWWLKQALPRERLFWLTPFRLAPQGHVRRAVQAPDRQPAAVSPRETERAATS